MLHRQELTAHHVAIRARNAENSSRPTARCRTSCSWTRRNLTSSRWQTSKMIEFGLPRYPQTDGSSPDANPQSVMVWAAITETGRSPLKSNRTPIAISPIFWRAAWAKKHFQGVPCFLQQDSVPSHASKFTKSWIQRTKKSALQ